MRLAIISDNHAGARGASMVFNEYFFDFWEKTFFPYLKKNNITKIFHLGDLVDSRKNINFGILNSWNKRFFSYMEKNNINFEAIVGNHDTHYKNTNEVDAITELFKKKYPNILVHTGPKEIDIDGRKILLLPWINSENYNETMTLIKTTSAKIAFGHLEIAGFEMDRGNICNHGLDRKIFDKFDKVYSGHYHHKSTDGTIEYLGSQYEMTWADYNDPKGFHILDTKTLKLDYIQNPHKMFYKHVYNEDDISYPSADEIRNKHVKILVTNRKDNDSFDYYMSCVEKHGAADLTIVETDMGVDVKLDDTIDESQGTIDILIDVAKKLPDDKVKSIDVEKLLRELYLESQNMEID